MVDLHPDLGSGHGTVTGKRPGAAGRGSRAANATNESKHHDWEQESKSTARVSNGRLDNRGHGLTRRKAGEHGEIGEDKDERDEEEQAGNSIDANGGNHGLGNLSRRVLDFFTHAA